MAYNQELTDRVRALLATEPTVEERKMFGSIGFKVNGKLCLGVGDHPDHVMMVRVGLDNYTEALQQPGADPAIMRGRERKGYVFLQQAAIASNEQLKYWVDMALSYNKLLTGQ
ncbi:MAG TPA: TfoX/Sxy family protein [Candidatus Saccharimonadales bacterium]|nr:TfoX/Sxy family protein [Candidatus Saccharimonadales bacterium]